MKIKKALAELDTERKALERDLTELIKERVDKFKDDHELLVKGIDVGFVEEDVGGTGPAIYCRQLEVNVDLGIALACSEHPYRHYLEDTLQEYVRRNHETIRGTCKGSVLPAGSGRGNK